MDKGLIWMLVVSGMALILLTYSRISKLKNRIQELEDAFGKIDNIQEKERLRIEERLSNTKDLNIGIVRSELDDILFISDTEIRRMIASTLSSHSDYHRKSSDIIKLRFQQAINNQYMYQYISYLFPEFSVSELTDDMFRLNEDLNAESANMEQRMKAIIDVVNKLNSIKSGKEMVRLQQRIAFLESLHSYDKSSTYISRLMADYETYEIEVLAKELDWGYSQERRNKVASIREIKAKAREAIEKSKHSEYALIYLISLFPDLENFLEPDDDANLLDTSDMQIKQENIDESIDEVSVYLSKDEYKTMSETERNQLALDRYTKRPRTKWQIGRDYELYISYKYRQQGFTVDEFGSYMRLGDLGRDLIAHKDATTLIIQCKYWSKKKQIHEKHVFQLFGTVSMYCIDNPMIAHGTKGVIITNTELSPAAQKMAAHLGIMYRENTPVGEYPSIKCNIRNGVRIYHLPFDQKYDDTIIKNKGEFYALTVQEAEDAGFRRARRWYGA